MHAPPNHTTKRSPIVASTHRRNSRPESHFSHQARHTHHNHTHPTPAWPARLRSSREPRSEPSGPARPSVPGCAPTSTQACRVLRPGLWAFAVPHSAATAISIGCSTLGRRACAAPKPESRLTDACRAPNLRGREGAEVGSNSARRPVASAQAL